MGRPRLHHGRHAWELEVVEKRCVAKLITEAKAASQRCTAPVWKGGELCFTHQRAVDSGMRTLAEVMEGRLKRSR